MNPEVSDKIIAGLLLIVGIINFVPIFGMLSAAKLESAYGVPVNDPNLQILLKHRALMLGILGGAIIYSAYNPALQPLAFVVGFVSMLGFVAMCWQAGEANALLRKVATIDIVASALLLVALIMRLTKN